MPASYRKSTVSQPFKLFFSDLHALSNYPKEIIALVSLAGNNCSGQPCLPAIVGSVLFAALGRVCVPVGKKIPLLMRNPFIWFHFQHLTKVVKVQVLHKQQKQLM